MDISLFSRPDVLRKVLLEFPGHTYTGDLVLETITYRQTVNTGKDFVVGVASSGELQFSLLDSEEKLDDTLIAGKEFRYLVGVCTGKESRWQEFLPTGGELGVPWEGLFYIINNSTLSVWKGGKKLPAPQRPKKAVKSIFVANGKLYCAHEESPWLTVYSISGETLVPAQTPTLTYEGIRQIIAYCQQHVAFTRQGNEIREYRVERLNLIAVDYMEEVYQMEPVGWFTAEEPQQKSDQELTVQAYDRMTLFDRVVDEWSAGIKYPVTLLQYLQSLCTYVGVELATTGFLHAGMVIRKNYKGQQVTGRQSLQWVAELAGSFARMTPDGKLELAWYGVPVAEITPDGCSDTKFSAFTIDPVDKLQIKAVENDIGVVVGTGTNLYTVEKNPLCYADSDEELRPAAQRLFDAVKAFSYIPGQAQMVPGCGNPLIRAGDVVSVEDLDGRKHFLPIMEVTHTGGIAVESSYLATGGQRRTVQGTMVNRDIIQLRGRTNELVRTLEETKSTLTAYQEHTNGRLTIMDSTVRQTAESITAEVTRATQAEGRMSSTIAQTAEQITLKVSKTDYTGDTIAILINQSATEILIQAARIDLKGYVTADSLETGNVVVQSGQSYEKIILKDGRINFYYGNSSKGSMYTNSNVNQDICISAESGRTINFATGGYLRGRILSDGTFDNKSYDFITEGAYLLSNGYSTPRGRIEADNSDNLCIVPYSSSAFVLIGTSGSLRDIKANNYYQGSYKGWTGAFGLGGNAIKTVTVKGGIITNVS